MKIAIVSSKRAVLTETFIHAHTLHLSGEKLIYHGGSIPQMLDDKVLKISFPFLYRIFRRVLRQFRFKTLSPEEVAFKNSLLKEKPDVILAEYGTTGAIITPIAKQLRIPLVVHFHGFDASENKTLHEFRELYLRMFDYSSAIIGVSNQMRNKLITLGAEANKVHYSPYGPNEIFFNNHPEFKTKTFLSVGRFIDKKAPHLTILAFKKCLEEHPDAQLHMVGNGPYMRICQDLTNQFKLNEAVIFHGAKDSDFVRQQMQNAFCFVQHSRVAESGDMEGTPVAIIEAQAAALPVISTYHAGIPDIVIHNETGYLVNEGEVEEMARHMIELAHKFTLAKELGSQGRQRIKENFTMSHHISSLDKILATAASSKTIRP